MLKSSGSAGAPRPAQADKAVDADPQVFCAHMNLDISHDLQSEQLLRPGTKLIPEPADDTDSRSADEDWSVPQLNPLFFRIQRDQPLCLSLLHLVCTGLLDLQWLF